MWPLYSVVNTDKYSILHFRSREALNLDIHLPPEVFLTQVFHSYFFWKPACKCSKPKRSWFPYWSGCSKGTFCGCGCSCAGCRPTWLCTVFSWLLKVMVRLVEVLGATWVIKGVLLWLTVSYMLTRRLQISMFWKHDLTLHRQTEREGDDESVVSLHCLTLNFELDDMFLLHQAEPKPPWSSANLETILKLMLA